MSDQNTSQPSFNIQRIYLKDLSLELPNAPKIFLETENPGVEVSIDVSSEKILDDIHEVVVTATVTTKIRDQVAFLVEGKQAGIFELREIPADQLDPLLGIVCPSIVYPYLRANIADTIQRSGFPPVHLAEINFQAFYEQRMAALAQQSGKESGIILPPGADARH